MNDARLVVLNARDAADRGAIDPHPHQGGRARAATASSGRSTSRIRATGARRRGQGAAARQRRRSLGRPRAVGRGRPERRPQCPAGAGQPHRRAEEVRRSARLFLPEPRRPHHLRHSLRGRFHADRHDRPGLSRATRATPGSATPRSTISASAASEYFAEPVRPRGHRLDLFRRAAALRRRRLEGAGGDARLCAEGRQPAAGAPIVNIFGGKITTYRRLAESMLEKIEGFLGASAASRGRPPRRCRAAISRRPASTPRCDKLKARLRFLDRAHRAPAGPALRHARARRCLASPSREADLGRHFGADLYEAEVRYLMRARMGADRRGRAVAADQARPAAQPRGGGGASTNS